MGTVLLISKLIGIGVPGLVDRERGIVYDVLNIPSWTEVPLKDILEKEFHIPVYINRNLYAGLPWE
jgi:glucokinase